MYSFDNTECVFGCAGEILPGTSATILDALSSRYIFGTDAKVFIIIFVLHSF